MEHFVNREPHDIAVHGGNPVKIPISCKGLDFLVNHIAMLKHAADEWLGEQPHLGFPGGGRRQLNLLSPMRRAFFLGDGGGALRVPELIQRPLQILRRIQVVLEQELHGVLACFASFAHEAKSKR